MSEHNQKHVFISYIRENQEQVDKLCHDLESHDVKVWLDRHSIKPGARWKDSIREAIRKGDFFIACFSNEYTSKTKTYMNEELTLAIEELRKYATGREWFIPVLLSECDVPDRSIGAGETLLDINWVPLYEDWDSGIERILSTIKPTPPEIQNLMYALRSGNKNVRYKVFAALGRSGDVNALHILIEAIKDQDENIREQAVNALTEIFPKAKAAVPALIEALKDKYDYVRRAAALALGNIRSEAKAAVPALIEALQDEHWTVRLSAKQALEMINTLEAQKAVEEYRKRPV